MDFSKLNGLIPAVIQDDSTNDAALVRSLCRALPCQVGGGIRTIERAREVLNAGARRVIVGSALFTPTNVNRVESVAAATARRLIAAGGIRSRAEVGALHSRGIDAVVGMAIYQGVGDPLERSGTAGSLNKERD